MRRLVLLVVCLVSLIVIHPVQAAPNGIVISQIYGDGGNVGNTYANDYIELFNIGTAAVDLSGWSVQYANANSATWESTPLGAVTLQPGQYLLIQQSGGAGGGQSLPTPDVIGTLGLNASNGKVALVRREGALLGVDPFQSDPTDPPIEDFVGYGSSPAAEGTPAPTLDDDLAGFRADCTDTDDNSADFSTGAPNPRNSSTAFAPCDDDGGGGDDGPPEVVSVSPSDGAMDVPIGANLSVSFSENVTPSGDWFTITCDTGGAFTANTSGGPQSYTLNPNSDFAYDDSCTVTILAAGISDQDGDPDSLPANYTWMFSTESAPVQNDPPGVVSVSPEDGATDVPVEADLSVSFSENVTTSGDWFTITCETGGAFTAGASGGPQSYTLNPNTDFAYDDSCTVTILAANVTDQDGDPDNLPANYTWMFSTESAPVQDDPPVVVSVSPEDGATDVPIGANLSVSFSENVTTSGDWFTITCETGGAFTAGASGGPQSYTLNPNTDFAYDDSCTVTILAANVTDQDGDPDNLPANYTWMFSTESAPVRDDPPGVVSVSPEDGAADVPVEADLSVSFSEDVTATSESFLIACSVGGAKPFTLGGGPRNYVLGPGDDFSSGETCTVTVIAAAVIDDGGTTMTEDYTWAFTIEDAPPQVSSTAPADGAARVPLNINVAVIFTERVVAAPQAFQMTCTTSGAMDFALAGGPRIYVLDPAEDLTHDESCTVTVIAVQISDLDGTASLTMTEDLSWSFSTAAADEADPLPSVVSLNPANGAVDVPTDTPITINFSEDIQPTEPWFTLACAEGGLIDTEAVGGPRDFTLTPESELLPDDTCIAIITAANVNDLDGEFDNMAADVVWSFRTVIRSPGAVPPMVESTLPADGAQGAALNSQIVVTFSESVGVQGDWFTLTCDESLPAEALGGPRQYVIQPVNPLPPSQTCTVTIFSELVTDLDARQLPEDYTWSFSTAADDASGTVCGTDFTPTYIIQGTGAQTAFSGTLTTEGVVVADFEATALGGFYIQDPTGDNNPASSDGLFIRHSGGDDVNIGDYVRVTGTVGEADDQTRLADVEIALCGTGQTVTPLEITLPFANADAAEPYEGMAVTLSQTLTVTDTSRLGQFGEVLLSSGGRLYHPTQITTPGDDAIAQQAANDLNQIVLDDPSGLTYPDPTPYLIDGATLRLGDSVTGAIGVMGHERFYPTEPPNFVPRNPRTLGPDKPADALRVVSFNVENYFNGPEFPAPRGADSAGELARQQAKLVAALAALDADVIGLMEIETDGYESDSAIATLVTALTAETGQNYALIVPPVSLGPDQIRVALIYRTASVNTVGDAAVLQSAPFNVRRRPLAQTFEESATGERFTVAVAHFKSKICAGAAGADADQGDGQGCWNALRTGSAQALVDWLATDPTNSTDADLLIIGDLNAYAQEDPIRAIQDAGYTDLIALNIGAGAVTHAFEGQSGTLDYALANNALLPQINRATVWNINADEPDILDYNLEEKSAVQRALNTGTPYRSSDHDPVVVDLQLGETGGGTVLEWLAPEGEISDGYGNPLYRWTNLDGADEYQLYLAPAESLGTPIYHDIFPAWRYCVGVTCEIDLTDLDEAYRLVNGAYRVYLRAWDDLEPLGNWLGPVEFQLMAEPPAAVTLLDLPNTVTSLPVLPWQLNNTAANASWFRVIIAPQDLPDSYLMDEWFRRDAACGTVESRTCAVNSTYNVVNGGYQLTVQGWGSGGYSEEASETFIINANKPAVPTALTVTTNQGRITIGWSDDVNSSWFQVYIAAASGEQRYSRWHQKTADLCNGFTCQLMPELDLTNGGYLLYVRGWGPASTPEDSATAWSDSKAFQLDFPPPIEPISLAVQEANTGHPLLSWQGQSGTTWYQVWIGDADFETDYVMWHQAEALGCAAPGICTLRPPLDLTNGEYLFYVQGWGPGRYSDWVQGTNIVVEALLPEGPQLEAPNNRTNRAAPVFRWLPSDEAVYYQLRIEIAGSDALAYDGGWLSAAELGCESGLCTLQIPDFILANGDYIWSVRGYSPAGVGGWSQMAFTVFR